MRSLSTQALLEAWYRGLTEPLCRRPLTLLTAVCPDIPWETLSTMSIGQRDAQLLDLRKRIFGANLNSITTCPVCDERLELNFKVSDIQADAKADTIDALCLDVDGCIVTFRLPNSKDLAAITDPSDEDATCRMLLERCVTHIVQDDCDLHIDDLPPQVIDTITEKMAEVDPQADVQLALVCPACGNKWQKTFDIVLYLWTEIEAWGRRVLHEVHALASAYGWHETDILDMHPWRRQFYLNLIQG